MEINNFNNVKPFMNFESEDVFYFAQILKRKKENPDVGSNSVVIAEYYIKSEEMLTKLEDEIKLLCKFHNARAYINITSKSFEKVAFQTLKKITDSIMNKSFKSIKSAYSSACGRSSLGQKKWIIDIDFKDIEKIKRIINEVNKIKSDFDENVIDLIPTVNGYHLITYPFNSKLLEPLMCEISFDIKKDSPTLLYYSDVN